MLARTNRKEVTQSMKKILTKSYKSCLPVVPLVKQRIEIDNLLNILGGRGKDIWEKSVAIREKLPYNFIGQIIKITTIYERTLYTDVDEARIFRALEACDIVEDTLKSRVQFESVQQEVKNKLKSVGNDELMFSRELERWIDSLDTNDFSKIKSILTDVNPRLDELRSEVRWYHHKQKVKSFGFLVAGIFFVWALYVMGRAY